MTQSKKDNPSAATAHKKVTSINIVVPAAPAVHGTDDESNREAMAKAYDNYNQVVLDAYKKKFNIEPKQDQNDNWLLNFENQKELDDFFKELVDEGKPFFCVEVDENGNRTGEYKMSYGDGELHEGNVPPNEINNLHQSFQKKMMEPQPKPEATASAGMKNLRNSLESMRSKQQQPASPTIDPKTEPGAPNPFDTTPKPK